MAKATINFHPPNHKWFLAPDFTAIALSDDQSVEECIDYVLQAKKRSLMRAERAQLVNEIERALKTNTVGELRELEEEDWKKLNIPLLCRVYLQHLISQSVSLTQFQLLECEFNSGLPLEMKDFADKITQILTLGFKRDDAVEALVVTGNKQTDIAAQYLLADTETRKMERERARRRFGKSVPPNRHYTIIARAKAEKAQLKGWIKKSTGQLELEMAHLKRQLASAKQETIGLKQRRDEIAKKNQLELYQEFLRGIIAEPTINTTETQRCDIYRNRRQLTNDDHKTTLKKLNLTEKIFDEMKTFEDTQTEDECLVCYEPPKDHMILPCHHVCLCGNCAEAYSDTIGDDAKCPLCDRDITAIKQIFYY